MPSQWAKRPDWSELPEPVRAAIEALLGAPVTRAQTPPGGHSPQLAARLLVADDRRVFVKATPAGSPLDPVNRREAALTAALPPGAPAPALLAAAETAGWFTAVYTDIPGRHPALTAGAGTGTGELTPVLDALATTATLPVSPSLRRHLRGSAAAVLAEYLHGWATLAARTPADLDPWASARLPELAAAERHLARAVAGPALGHSDARPDNMLIHDGAVTLVDWAHALTGAPWLDAAFLVPLLMLHGWPPGPAVEAVFTHPFFADTDRSALTTFWVALTGYWQRSARLPAPAGSPGIRPYQRRAAAAGVRLLQQVLA